MSKEMDEITEKVVRILCDICEDAGAFHCQLLGLCESVKCDAAKLLSLQTPTCRLAVVRKEAELPSNPWNVQSISEWYRDAQEDMLEANFRQEVTE